MPLPSVPLSYLSMMLRMLAAALAEALDVHSRSLRKHREHITCLVPHINASDKRDGLHTLMRGHARLCRAPAGSPLTAVVRTNQVPGAGGVTTFCAHDRPTAICHSRLAVV